MRVVVRVVLRSSFFVLVLEFEFFGANRGCCCCQRHSSTSARGRCLGGWGLAPKCLECGFVRRFLPNVVVCVVMFC